MKKNLLNKPAVERMIYRVQSLQPGYKGKWGTMNATEMLLHINLTNNQILEGDLAFKKTTLKQRLLKYLALYLVPNFPKNTQSAPRNHTKGCISDGEFDNQKKLFIDTMTKYVHHNEKIELTHPAFGQLNTTQWGIAAWKHTDHHLRQFGV